jgi:cephalosporin hydroxylase
MSDKNNFDSILQTVDHVVSNPDKIIEEEWIEGVGEQTGIEYIEGNYKGYGNYHPLHLQQTKDSIEGLAKAVKKESPSRMMEIGTYRGGSLYVWSQYLESVNKIISLDIDFQGRKDFYPKFNPNKEINLLTSDSHRKETRKKVEDMLNGSRLDFLYIDGDHSYEGVKNDFEMYHTLLTDDGIIGMHDITHPGTGVPKFWSEINEKYQTAEFGNSVTKNGLVYL